MNNFLKYAEYYDLLNKEKDYFSECSYVINLQNKYNPDPILILDFGCGTGRHAIEFAKMGYKVTGVDASLEMINIATSKLNQLDDKTRENLKFYTNSDMFSLPEIQNDLTVSLFHVSNYQTTQSRLETYLNQLAEATRTGGLVIFDYWYLPAVIHLKPEVRVREIEDSSLKITRIAKPVSKDENIISVNFTIFVEDKNVELIYKVEEVHDMRPFDLDVIQRSIPKSLSLLDTFSWNTLETPTVHDWTAVSVFRKK